MLSLRVPRVDDRYVPGGACLVPYSPPFCREDTVPSPDGTFSSRRHGEERRCGSTYKDDVEVPRCPEDPKTHRRGAENAEGRRAFCISALLFVLCASAVALTRIFTRGQKDPSLFALPRRPGSSRRP